MKNAVSVLLLAGSVSVVCTAQANAQACVSSGIPVVNARTAALGSTVSAYMAAGTAQLIALHEQQTEMLVSAVKTGVAQTSTSGDQISTTAVKANEATASAYVASDQAMQLLDETDRYQSLGYNACGIPSSMQSFHEAYKQTFSGRPAYIASVRAKPGVIADPKGYYGDILKGSNFSAQSLFDGDAGAAEKYMNAIMGPPDSVPPNSGSTPAGSLFLREKLTRDARKSVALYAMDEIAKENANGGAKRAMNGVIDAYVGDDGGATWAASMAGSHERGILLDAVRIEAANLAGLVFEIRQQQRTELVAATYALSRADKLIGGARNANRPPIIAIGRQAEAQ